MEYFVYGEKETEYLKRKDKKLAAVIDRLGHIERAVEPDLFFAVVNNIVGQQISSKAHRSIRARMENELGEISPDVILSAGRDKLQSFGITFRKADYIVSFAERVKSGEFDLEAVSRMSDEEAIKALSSQKGVGVWTAEMVLLFSLRRPDILSFGDLGIIRGLKMLYHHESVDKERFERYRKRFSPYGSVASFYLWAVAGGAPDKENNDRDK